MGFLRTNDVPTIRLIEKEFCLFIRWVSYSLFD